MATDVRTRPVHPVDEVLPAPKLAIYGFQHVLAFYAGAVIVPILLANAIGLNTQQLIHLINADLLTCGIASIIQSVGFWKVGVRLPLLQGVTFTAVSPMIAIGLASTLAAPALAQTQRIVEQQMLAQQRLVAFDRARVFAVLLHRAHSVSTGENPRQTQSDMLGFASLILTSTVSYGLRKERPC